MKICFISNYCNGGFKSFLNNYVNFLTSLKHEVSVIYLGDSYLNNSNVKNEIKIDLNSKKHHLNIKEFCFTSSFIFKRFFKLAQYALSKNKKDKRLEYKILKSQCIVAKKVLKSGVKLDLNEYDCVISAEELMCNYFLANNTIAKRKIAFIHPDYKLAHFNAKIDKYFLKNVDLICAVSNSGADSIKSKLKEFKDKIIGVPNYINVNEIINKLEVTYDDASFDKSVINLVTVCRLDNSSKALDRLLDLSIKLKNDNYKFVWRIIGDGEYKENMIQFIKDNHLEKEVILLGQKDNPFPYVKESDLFVLQSYYEGYPISACEALICETPVLLTNFPSAYEIISNKEYGEIVENNFDSIYLKLKELFNNKDILISKKKALHQIDKNNFLNAQAFLNILSK